MKKIRKMEVIIGIVIGLIVGAIMFSVPRSSAQLNREQTQEKFWQKVECHSCFETEWQSQTATVTCDQAGEVTQYLRVQLGYTSINMKTRIDPQWGLVCDILAAK